MHRGFNTVVFEKQESGVADLIWISHRVDGRVTYTNTTLYITVEF